MPRLALALCSGSMEPAFQRGDILFLTNQDAPIRVGEIVVFKIKDRDIPIVHRVMKVPLQAVPASAVHIHHFLTLMHTLLSGFLPLS